MALSKFNKNVENIIALDDNPNEGATPLSTSELKERFDQAGVDIKNYINNTLTSEIDAGMDNILTTNISKLRNMIYPIGSIYMSVNNVNPALFIGGTWEEIQDRFLLASGSTYIAGSTGGEATVTLTTNQMPSHTHGSKSLTGSVWNLAYQSKSQSISTSGIASVRTGSEGVGYATNEHTARDGFTINATHEHNSVGGNQAHNNMPPYLAVYVWKRVS